MCVFLFSEAIFQGSMPCSGARGPEKPKSRMGELSRHPICCACIHVSIKYSYIPRSRSLSKCLLLQVRPSHLRRPHICAPVPEVLNIHRVHPLPAGRSFPSCVDARHFRSLPTSCAHPQGPAELPALHPQVYERRRHRPSMKAASPVLHTARQYPAGYLSHRLDIALVATTSARP